MMKLQNKIRCINFSNLRFSHKSFEINHSVDLVNRFALLRHMWKLLKGSLFEFEQAAVSFGHIKWNFVKNSNDCGKYFHNTCL